MHVYTQPPSDYISLPVLVIKIARARGRLSMITPAYNNFEAKSILSWKAGLLFCMLEKLSTGAVDPFFELTHYLSTEA